MPLGRRAAAPGSRPSHAMSSGSVSAPDPAAGPAGQQAGAGYLDGQHQDLSGARAVGQPVEVGGYAVGRPPFGGQDEQGPPVRAAEHQRERCPVLIELDPLQDLAAVGDPHDRGLARGHPDRALGVQADPVRSQVRGEHAPAGQPAVGVDVERGELASERLGDDQRPVVRGDDHAVGEGNVTGDLAQLPVGREELDVAGRGRLPAGEVEVSAVEVDVAAPVHDDLVRLLPGYGDQRPVRLLAAQPVPGHQQTAVGQPVDRVPHQLDRAPGRGDLRLAVKADGKDLPVDPVAEPQPALVPPRRLGNPQTTQQHRWLSHDSLLASPGRASAGGPFTPYTNGPAPDRHGALVQRRPFAGPAQA